MERRNLFKLGLSALFPLTVIKAKSIAIKPVPSKILPTRKLTIDDFLKLEAYRITQEIFMKDYVKEILGSNYKFPKQ
jgi:hypothetical protein